MPNQYPVIEYKNGVPFNFLTPILDYWGNITVKADLFEKPGQRRQITLNAEP
jgi:hypothetical protein